MGADLRVVGQSGLALRCCNAGVPKAALPCVLVLVVGIQAGAAPSNASAPPPAARVCAVTQPNGGGGFHGNGGLSTALWTYNVLVADARFIQADGSVRMKFPWWRHVRGDLRVTGRRLDRRAPPLRADIASGYGRIGLQPTSLVFPTDGCWRITGRVGRETLTFVTLVVKVPHLTAKPS